MSHTNKSTSASPNCPRCHTPTLNWYGDYTEDGTTTKNDYGYRCTQCGIYVCVPYQGGPRFYRPETLPTSS